MRTKFKYRILMLVLVILTLGISAFSAQAYVGVRVRPRYFYAPRPFYYYGYYDPFWYGPGWYGPPAYYAVPRYVHETIKTEVEPKDAEVFVNGGYVGTANKFRGAFHGLDLRPGNYDLEIRAPHYEPLRIKLYVAANQTIKLKEHLRPVY